MPPECPSALYYEQGRTSKGFLVGKNPTYGVSDVCDSRLCTAPVF